DRGNQTFLALGQQRTDHPDVVRGNPDLVGDLFVAVTPTPQCINVLKQIDGAMLTACAIFDQTHDEAVAFCGVNDRRRDLCLTQTKKGLDATLSANEIVLE